MRIAPARPGGFNEPVESKVASEVRPMLIPKRLGLGLWIGVASAGLGFGAALAEPPAPKLPAPMQRLLDCRAAPDATRLACYDAASAEFDHRVGSGDLVVVDHEGVARVKRQAFGFSLPSLSLFERGDKAQDLARVSGVVARASRGPEGEWILVLADGGVWRQTDSERLAPNPKEGSTVEIRKAAVGSFFMNIDGQRALRVKRTQ
jgi:hypothetical protein